MKVFVTGISGGLGREFVPYGVDGCSGTEPFGRFPAADLTRPRVVEELLAAARPDLLIHTVGWVDVDGCERDPDRAAAINFRTLLHLRRWAGPLGFRIVYISTNDVFSGARGSYREQDRPDPINVYSMTKAAAEAILRPDDLIVRAPMLAWNCRGKVSFVRWLVESLERGDRPALFTDQFTSPVTATTLAGLLMEGLSGETGIVHVATERHSRWEVGCAVAGALGLPVDRIRRGSLDDHRFDAPRPRDVSLDSFRLEAIIGRRLRLADEAERLAATRPATAAAGGGGPR
jgi:dTDP-4-dehydrorhamnose reductase